MSPNVARYFKRVMSAELWILLVLGGAVHVLVLRFLFPGYYDPFWPHHSDFYIGPALAHGKAGFSEVLSMARPVGMLYFKITGYLGIRGAIAANLVLVLLNVAMTAAFIRRAIGSEFSLFFLICFCVFAYLVFAHPYQYVWSTYDVFTQLSYAFLMMAALMCLRQHTGWLFLMCIGFAFLSKETYAASVLALLALWWLCSRADQRRFVAKVGCMIVAAVVLSVLINKIAASQFLGVGASAGSPYEIVLKPLPLFQEWLRYAREGYAPQAWMLVALSVCCAMLAIRRGPSPWTILPLALGLAGVLAWLPNSVIPNHHAAEYAFSGAMLLYAPILTLASAWQRGKGYRLAAGMLLVLATLMPLLDPASYARNAWVIEQQIRQKQLLKTLDALFDGSAGTQESVLVSGLDFPFSPFDHPYSLYSYKNFHGQPIRVLRYSEGRGTGEGCADKSQEHAITGDRQGASIARDIDVGRVGCVSFDTIWMFRQDGSLLASVRPEQLPFMRNPLGFSALDFAMFPGVAVALFQKPLGPYGAENFSDGDKLMACGNALMSYHQYAKALVCLRASMAAIPGNPYPYFYAAQALETLNQIGEARSLFAAAVARDNQASPNPAFRAALDRVRKSGQDEN